MFSETGPDKVAEKLLDGFNKVVNKLLIKKRIQLTKNSLPYWTKELTESKRIVKDKMNVARPTKSHEDKQDAKHARNRHSALIKSTIKNFYQRKLNNNKRKFKSIKKIQENESKTPTCIISKGVEYTSPREIAEVMANTFIEKVEKTCEYITGNEFKAINTLKKLIPRVKEKWMLKTITVDKVYTHLLKTKNSNSRGNDELTARILKQMPTFIFLSICHLFNTIVRKENLPNKLKTARLTLLHKQGKSKTDPLSYRPISNLSAVEKTYRRTYKRTIG